MHGIGWLLILLAVAWFAPPAFAATGNCVGATSQGTNGPADYASYCWVDFVGYNDALARSGAGQPFAITLRDGGSMTFTLKVNTALTVSAAPSWSGAPFGATAFVGVSGRPVLYQATNGATTTVTLSNISVTVGAGQVPYAFVAADAESTNDGETVNFTTNGDAWTLLASMKNGASTLFPALTGVGTTTVSEAGVAGNVGAYAFASSNSPTTVSSVMKGSGLQGIAFGMKYRAADLTVASSHSGGFQADGSGSYALTVHNNGPDTYSTANTITVTDTLPTGLGYVSASGSGWSCGAVGQVVTCNANANLGSGADLPAITLNVNVATTAPASVTNTVSVSVLDGYDFNAVNNTTTDATAIVHPNLSTSTKEVEDADGGMAKPGDTLRYTINLVESGGIAATNLQVTDTLVANLGSLSLVSIPAGATNASVGNSLNVTGISMPANGTATIVFTAVISGSAAQGAVINNTATIRTSGNVPVGTAVADPVTVEIAQPPAAGNKYLYLNTAPSLALTRARPGTGADLTFRGSRQCFNLAPLSKALTLSSATVSISLRMRRADTNNGNRRLRMRFYRNGTSTQLSANTDGPNLNTATYNNFTNATMNITLAGTTFAAGEFLVFCVENRDNRDVVLSQNNGGAYSYVRLNAATVINVDSVATYAAAYTSTATKARYLQGEHAYIRAVVSDPFGNADITGATIKITDAGGTVQVPAGAMTSVATTASTRTYEYDYTIPMHPRIGGWTAEILAKEGQEPDAPTHTGIGGIPVEGKLSLGKGWVNGTAGNTVSLAISGGTTATAGSSTPASTTAAMATATASANITLAESFTVGSASSYTTPSLSCLRDKDGVILSLGGSGPSRTITMPNDSAVTCTFTNTRIIPLTVVKLSTVHSDPVNGTTNPKAIPGALVEYRIIILNPSTIAVDNGSVIITDPIPPQLGLHVADIGAPGSGPVQFVDGAPSSGLMYTFTSLSSASDDVAFSDDGGATWTYVPTPGGDGIDPAVTHIQINPQGGFNPDDAAFTVKLRMRID